MGLMIIIKIVFLGFALVLVVHVLACGWYGVGYYYAGGWVHKESIHETSFLNQYFTSLRWTIAQLNGRTDLQHGRSMREKSYICLVAMFKILLMSIVVGYLTTQLLELQKVYEKV